MKTTKLICLKTTLNDISSEISKDRS